MGAKLNAKNSGLGNCEQTAFVTFCWADDGVQAGSATRIDGMTTAGAGTGLAGPAEAPGARSADRKHDACSVRGKSNCV
jgi:hypothetical protein